MISKLMNIAVAGGIVAACTSLYAQSKSSPEIKCLADNIYFESSNQSEVGQIAVANVTMNRMYSKHFPNTICDVVWEPKQFSWTHDGKSDVPSDAAKYASIYNLAELVYNHDIPDVTEGATFYHADYVNPPWASAMDEKVAKIDNHIFYRHKGR